LELRYPPLSRLTLVELKGENEEQVRTASERLAQLLKLARGPFEVLGPAPAVIGKIKKLFRWHIIVRAPKVDDPSGSLTRRALSAAIDGASVPAGKVQVIADVDPVGLM